MPDKNNLGKILVRDPEQQAREVGAEILEGVKQEMGQSFNQLAGPIKEVLSNASVSGGRLLLRRLAGEDVRADLFDDVDAQLHNGKVAAQIVLFERARAAFWKSLLAIASGFAGILGGPIGGLAKTGLDALNEIVERIQGKR